MGKFAKEQKNDSQEKVSQESESESGFQSERGIRVARCSFGRIKCLVDAAQSESECDVPNDIEKQKLRMRYSGIQLDMIYMHINALLAKRVIYYIGSEVWARRKKMHSRIQARKVSIP